VRRAIARKGDCEGAYYLLGRTLFASGRYSEVVDIADAAIEASGEDYNIYVPIQNALSALGKKDALLNEIQQEIQVIENHLKKVPEDARARTLLARDFIQLDRRDDAVREVNLAMALRPNEATILYNVACVYVFLGRKADALDALTKAWTAGFKDPSWARHDPDLESLHGDPEFERLYPATAG
jgi:Flp pilus assembly protein TadD